MINKLTTPIARLHKAFNLLRKGYNQDSVIDEVLDDLTAIAESPERPAYPTVFAIVRPDRREGNFRISSSGLYVYPEHVVAKEDLDRIMMKAGEVVAELYVLTEPMNFGTAEQRAAWDKKRGK